MTLHRSVLDGDAAGDPDALGLVPPAPAKLATPRDRPGLIVRKNLLDLLLASVERPLVVVSAPAGYGKSTAVAQCCAADPRPAVWVTLDAADNDPAVLVSAVLGALAPLVSTPSRRPTAITASEPAFTTRVLPFLARTLARVDEPILLVLDDVHSVTEPGSHAVISELLANLPAGCQLVLATRTRPPLPLARLAAHDQVLEVGPDRLAFDLQECRRALSAAGLDLPDATVATIARRTEGWPVGVYLSGLACADGALDGPAHAESLGADRLLAGFVREEILDLLDPPDVTFLVRTSVLTALCGPLCDAVTAGTGSAQRLESLATRSSLVVPLDRQGSWYRCHPLLGEALRARLRHLEPVLVPTLHRRASAWYAEHGEMDEAVRHARLSGDLEWLTDLIWPHVVRLITLGRAETLRRWVDGLPDASVASSTRLSTIAGWLAFYYCDGVALRRWTNLAQARLGSGWVDRLHDRDPAVGLALLLSLTSVDGMGGHAPLAQRCCAVLGPDSQWLPLALFLSGLGYQHRGERQAAIRELEQASALSAVGQAHSIHASCVASLAMDAIATADWVGAADLATRAYDDVLRRDLRDTPTGAYVFPIVALTQAATGNDTAAAVTLATARNLVERASEGVPWIGVQGHVLMAWTSVLLGDVLGARRLLAEGQRLVGAHAADLVTAGMVREIERRIQLATEASLGVSGALTPAEARVLEYLPSRLSIPEIATRLHVSRHTVKSQVMGVYRKLGATNRAEAVARAEALSLVPDPTVLTSGHPRTAAGGQPRRPNAP